MSKIAETGRKKHNVLDLSVRPSVCPFVCYQTCEDDILKRNEPILMPTDTGGEHGKGVNNQLWDLRGPRSRLDEVRVRFEGLAEDQSRPPWV